jgi:CRP/FNR family cyclic AMP-dependent transcriptional regulator
VVFSQGDPATHVFYIQKGSIKIAVLSRAGKEAVVGILGQGDFFGEGCLAGQPRRMATAAVMSAATVLAVEQPEMLRVLHSEPALADRFLAHMLARNIRIEEDLVDQLFNSSEKRLARALLLLARYGTDSEQLLLPKVSQETLAKIVGTTRSRVNFFMNKFRDLGFLTYDDAITVHRSLLTVVLHD